MKNDSGINIDLSYFFPSFFCFVVKVGTFKGVTSMADGLARAGLRRRGLKTADLGFRSLMGRLHYNEDFVSEEACVTIGFCSTDGFCAFSFFIISSWTGQRKSKKDRHWFAGFRVHVW